MYLIYLSVQQANSSSALLWSKKLCFYHYRCLTTYMLIRSPKKGQGLFSKHGRWCCLWYYIKACLLNSCVSFIDDDAEESAGDVNRFVYTYWLCISWLFNGLFSSETDSPMSVDEEHLVTSPSCGVKKTSHKTYLLPPVDDGDDDEADDAASQISKPL